MTHTGNSKVLYLEGSSWSADEFRNLYCTTEEASNSNWERPKAVRFLHKHGRLHRMYIRLLHPINDCE